MCRSAVFYFVMNLNYSDFSILLLMNSYGSGVDVACALEMNMRTVKTNFPLFG